MNLEITNDGFLSERDTYRLIEFTRQHHLPIRLDELCVTFAHHRSVSLIRTKNTFQLLIVVQLAKLSSDSITILDVDRGNDRRSTGDIISMWCVESMIDRFTGSGLPLPIEWLKEKNRFYVDSLLIPTNPWSLNFWLLEFGVLQRNKLTDRYWVVSERYSPRIRDAALQVCRDQTVPGMSLERLLAKLEHDRAQGIAAEEWVLKYERTRLAAHPLLDMVRQVSTEATDAGFDIASFSATSILSYDRFIEVKSFIGEPHFYMSRNEVFTAIQLRRAYKIYLVDMIKCNQADYAPIVIQDVATLIENEQSSSWIVESDGIVVKSRLD